MCKKKDKKDEQKAAVVGTAGAVGYASGTTAANVKPSGSVAEKPISVTTGNISPKNGTKVPRKKPTAQKVVLTGLDIVLKILNGIKYAAIAIGIILGMFVILGLIYAYLAITGVIEPDPQAFFDSIKFWNH